MWYDFFNVKLNVMEIVLNNSAKKLTLNPLTPFHSSPYSGRERWRHLQR